MLKKIILILVGVLLLVGGIFGVLWATDNLSLIFGEEQAVDPELPKEGSAFFEMQTLRFPILRGRNVVGHAVVDVTINVVREERDTVELELPKVQDAFVREVVSFVNLQIDEVAAFPEVETIDTLTLGKRLRVVGNRVLDGKPIDRVYVEGFYLRPSD